MIAARWPTDLERTVVVVVSASPAAPSRPTASAAPSSQAFTDAGIDAASRIVVVTDPGSPFEKLSADEGYRSRSWPTRTSAAATARSPRSGWSRRRWPAPTSPSCSTRPPRRRRRCRPTAPDNPALVLAPSLAGSRRPRQARSSRPRARHRRLRRLGRAADRRVHRQERHRRPAGRRRGPQRARAAQRRRRPGARAARGGHQRGDGRVRYADRRHDRFARRAVPALGDRDRGRPGTCSASTRSTSRTWRAPRRPRAVCSTPSPSRRPPRSPTAPWRSAATDGLLDGVDTAEGALDALLGQLADNGYLAVWPTSTPSATRT